MVSKGLAQRHRDQTRQTGRQSHRHLSRQGPTRGAQGFSCHLDLVQNAPAMFQQQLAAFGQLHAPAIALQQVLMQLDLQQSHLPAQSRLGNAQCHRGPGKAAQFSHPHKISDLPQVHEWPFLDL